MTYLRAGEFDAQALAAKSVRERKDTIRRVLLAKWNMAWTQEEVGEVTREFLGTVEERMSVPWLHPDLHQLFILTGHGSLNAYLHRIGTINMPDCHCGAPEETAMHVLWSCPTYQVLRTWDPDAVDAFSLLAEERYGYFVRFCNDSFARRRTMPGEGGGDQV